MLLLLLLLLPPLLLLLLAGWLGANTLLRSSASANGGPPSDILTPVCTASTPSDQRVHGCPHSVQGRCAFAPEALEQEGESGTI